MARKHDFGSPLEQHSQPEQVSPVDTDRPLASKRRSIIPSPSVSLLSKSLQLAAQDENAEALRAQLLAGQTIIELDPKQIDPSFVSDRLPDPNELTTLVDSVRERGQQSPILVRPHPDHPNRYQIAFGHRRWRAAQVLGIPVKAVVRNLSDEDLVVAQGKENSDRTDLSFIERARFAAELLGRGYSRELIMLALSVPRQTLSQYLSIISKLPPDIVEAIGPAPAQGRRPWQLIAELLASDENKLLARDALKKAHDDQSALTSELRFELVRKAITLRRSRNTEFSWTSKNGETVAAVTDGKGHFTIRIDKKVADGFGDYLVKHLETIWKDYKAQK